MNICILDRESENDSSILQEALRSGFDDVTGSEAILEAALTHVLANPGNLGRARACLAVGRVVGLTHESALSLAMGVEYFHTASLLFDDLPCMDDASERRSVSCVHRVYGESAAVLAALALVNRAYRLMWKGMGEMGAVERGLAADYIDARLGVLGILGGQSFDLHDASVRSDPRGVMVVARLKTVPLLQIAVLLPVLLTGGEEALVSSLERYCLVRGVAYQMADDLKDVVGTASVVGKTTGRDSALDRPNIVNVAGFQGARARLLRLNGLGDRILDRLPGGRQRWGFLDALRPDEGWEQDTKDSKLDSAAI